MAMQHMDILRIKPPADLILTTGQLQNSWKEAEPWRQFPAGAVEKSALLCDSLSTSHAMPLTLWAGAGPGLLCVPAQARPVRWRN